MSGPAFKAKIITPGSSVGGFVLPALGLVLKQMHV